MVHFKSELCASVPPSIFPPSLPSAVQFNFVTVVEDDEVDEEEAALFWALDNEQPQGWEEDKEINYSEMADRSMHSECVCVVCVCVTSWFITLSCRHT